MPLIADLKVWADLEILTAPDLNATFAEIKTKVNSFAAFKDQVNAFTQANSFGAGITVTGNATVSGTVTGNALVGNGAGLTALPAGQLTGTLPNATFPATLPAVSGANLTSLPAANLTGVLPAISGINLTSLNAASLSGTLPALNGASLTNLNASNIASGTLSQARLPTTLTAITIGTVLIGSGGGNNLGPQATIQGAVLRGQSGGGITMDMRRTLDGGTGYFITTSGTNDAEWIASNNGNVSNSTPQGGPAGLTTYAQSSAVFLKVRAFGGLDYYIRCERWT